MHVNSVVRGGGMVKPTWAVACLLAVFLFVGLDPQRYSAFLGLTVGNTYNIY
jgi:hypothetical protein